MADVIDGLDPSILGQPIIFVHHLEFFPDQIFKIVAGQPPFASDVDGDFVEDNSVAILTVFFPLVVETGWNVRAQNECEGKLVLPRGDALPLRIRVQAIFEVVKDPVLHKRRGNLPSRRLCLIGF